MNEAGNADTQREDAEVLWQQLEYYRARAGEYDQWWTRQGRYDRGPERNAQWFAEGKEVADELAECRPKGRILELACGTGIWTSRLLPFASSLTALDGSEEVLAISQSRHSGAGVRYVQADLFDWRPDQQYDFVFFGFWLSHVPPQRFDQFWSLVMSCLAPGGRVFFVDSRHEPTSTASDHRMPTREGTVARRRLNDGREFDIVKVFYEPGELTDRLKSLGWNFGIRATDRYFIYGVGTRDAG